MAVGTTRAAALVGVQGYLVEVMGHVASGLPAFVLTGLPDASVSEARDRVRAATESTQVPLPLRKITVGLSPAALPKAGAGFDLAIAVAVLAATGAVPEEAVAGCLHVGELALDGRLRPVPGVLPALVAAAAAGVPRAVVPRANAAEAALVPGLRVVPAGSLGEVLALHRGLLDPAPLPPAAPAPAPPLLDLADVVGQVHARRALEVAAGGGHHLWLTGPPGAGKTMLAARLPGLLPDLDDGEALEVTAVHSVAGALAPGTGLVRRPPFQDPHHTSSAAAVVGGGTRVPRPGAATLAHRGVLLLDEAPEFDRRALEALRQPLEHGELVVERAGGRARYPARFQLVLTSNPCPCGLAGLGRGDRCACPPAAVRRYRDKLSGPLLDRVDLQVEVLPVSRADVLRPEPAEGTAPVAARVRRARRAQRARLAATPWRCNGEVPGSWLRGPLELPLAVTRPAAEAVEAGRLTVRGFDRVLRTAWTVADLAGADAPSAAHVQEALVLRQREGVGR